MREVEEKMKTKVQALVRSRLQAPVGCIKDSLRLIHVFCFKDVHHLKGSILVVNETKINRMGGS